MISKYTLFVIFSRGSSASVAAVSAAFDAVAVKAKRRPAVAGIDDRMRETFNVSLDAIDIGSSVVDDLKRVFLWSCNLLDRSVKHDATAILSSKSRIDDEPIVELVLATDCVTVDISNTENCNVAMLHSI